MQVVRACANQAGVLEGEIKYFCSACMKAFVVPSLIRPAKCPAGHASESADEFATAS